MVIRLEAWVILIRIRPIWHTRLVKVLIYRIGGLVIFEKEVGV